MKRADSLLIPVVRELGIEDSVKLAEIKKTWHNLFNKPISYHMSPYKLSNSEIFLNVDSPVWLQELNFHKEEIIRKLSFYGVRAVRFRLGKVSTKATSEAKSKKSRVKPLTTEELSYIEETVSLIDDRVLRETLRRTIEKALTSGRTKQ